MDSNHLFTRASSRVSNNPIFKHYYMSLAKSEFSKQKENLEFDVIKRLLETAAIFSLSKNEDHRKLALKIALFILRQYKHEYDAIPKVVELVLARMGDLPTIRHMVENENEQDYFSFFARQEQSVSYVKFPEILLKKRKIK